MKWGDVQAFEQQLAQTPSAGPVQRSGFRENFVAGFGTFMDEDTTIGEWLNSGAYKERDREIDRLISSGQLPEEEYLPYVEDGDIDYPRLAYALKRSGRAIRDDYDVRDGIRETLKQRRDMAQEIHSRATTMGAVGIFAGQMTAAQLDPVNAAAMLIPGLGIIRAGTTMARVGKTALYYGALSAGAEAIIQPQVYSWKNELGVDYSVGDAVVNIGIAGVGGALLGTAAEIGTIQVQKGFQKLKKNVAKQAPKEERTIKTRELEQAEREFNAHVMAYRLREEANGPGAGPVPDEQRPLGEGQEGQAPEETGEAEAGQTEAQEVLAEVEPDIVLGKEDFDDLDGFGALYQLRDEMDAELKAIDELGEAPEPEPTDSLESGDYEYPYEMSRQLDDEAKYAAYQMDRLNKIEEELALDPTDNGLEQRFEVEDDIFEEPEPSFDGFQEEAYAKMSQEERDAYVSELLGEDLDAGAMNVEEIVGVDGNGDPMYQTRSRSEVNEDIDEFIEQMDDFETCWTKNVG